MMVPATGTNTRSAKRGILLVLRSARVGALVAAVSLSLVPVAGAQKRGARVRVLAGSALRTTPGGPVLGILSRSLDADVESEQGSSVRVRVSGFVSAGEVQIDARQARATVGGSGGARLRLASGEKEPVLAELRRGAVLFPAGKAAAFVPVSRPVWVDKSRLAKFTAAKSSPASVPTEPRKAAAGLPAPAPVAGAAGLVGATPRAATPAQPVILALPPMQANALTTLRTSPDGNPLASIRAGATVQPLSADKDWTRVRMEGWVPTRDLRAAGTRAADQVSAADLRADPDGAKGKVVHWEVEALSYQLSDGLRRELNGEPYLLALGPGKERAILYLAVPDSLVSVARALAPLSTISITARVRSGRSQPAGVPILDLIELSRR